MAIVNCLKQMNELNIKTTMAVAFSSSSLEEHKSAWVEGGVPVLWVVAMKKYSSSPQKPASTNKCSFPVQTILLVH